MKAIGIAVLDHEAVSAGPRGEKADAGSARSDCAHIRLLPVYIDVSESACLCSVLARDMFMRSIVREWWPFFLAVGGVQFTVGVVAVCAWWLLR
jgi:hypothetical protein